MLSVTTAIYSLGSSNWISCNVICNAISVLHDTSLHKACIMLIWLLEKIQGFLSLLTYWRARRMFKNDPELQAINKRIHESIEKAERQAEAYCDKYGCIEPTENTIVLEKFKDIRAKRSSHRLD